MTPIEIAIPIELNLDDLPDGVAVHRSQSNLIEFSETGRNWPIYFVTAATTIGLNLFSQFIYESVLSANPTPPKTIVIEEEEVTFDKGQIERTLRRRTTIENIPQTDIY